MAPYLNSAFPRHWGWMALSVDGEAVHSYWRPAERRAACVPALKEGEPEYLAQDLTPQSALFTSVLPLY